MAGWGAYGSAPKANPFAEDEAKAENSASATNYGAWDIPLRDTDDQTGSGATQPQQNLTAPKPAAKPSRGGFFGFGGKKSSATNGQTPQFANKEEELAWREEQLRQREAEVAKIAGRAKNWPPCKPILYHDIAAEIPGWNRRMVRVAYLAWLLGAGAFFVNWITVLVLMFANLGKIGVRDFFICSLATVIGLPMSFTCWYRNLYYAAQSDGSTYRYVKTMLWMLIQMAWAINAGLAIPFIGEFNAGFFVMLDVFDHGGGKAYAIGVMCVIAIVLWGLSSLIIFFSLGSAVSAMRAADAPRRAFEAKNIGSIQLPA